MMMTSSTQNILEQRRFNILKNTHTFVCAVDRALATAQMPHCGVMFDWAYLCLVTWL